MHIGIAELTFRLDGCRSLKEKRHVVRSLVDRLRHQFNASVAEVAHQDEWTLAGVGLALVNSDRRLVERLLEQVVDYAERTCEAELIGLETELL
ncbi:MAG: DUF503 domain-containing protein [Fimbriimonadaceae bacterium]|nr:DUF503 domain-containing protein [Fimbriimonadaceae bacterium]